MSKYYVGLDLGQSHDFTALAVVERAEIQGEWDPARFRRRVETSLRLRHIERIPLGTSYPEIVERVAQVMTSDTLRDGSNLIVDGTGVGRPVVDLLRNRGMRCFIRPVLVTSGLRETQQDGYYGVPKRDLILGLQMAVQAGYLKLASGLEFGPALVKEMTEMKVRLTPSGTEQFGAWREGTHDDLVFAVALACWGAEKWKPQCMEGQRRLI